MVLIELRNGLADGDYSFAFIVSRRCIWVYLLFNEGKRIRNLRQRKLADVDY